MQKPETEETCIGKVDLKHHTFERKPEKEAVKVVFFYFWCFFVIFLLQKDNTSGILLSELEGNQGKVHKKKVTKRSKAKLLSTSKDAETQPEGKESEAEPEQGPLITPAQDTYLTKQNEKGLGKKLSKSDENADSTNKKPLQKLKISDQQEDNILLKKHNFEREPEAEKV